MRKATLPLAVAVAVAAVSAFALLHKSGSQSQPTRAQPTTTYAAVSMPSGPSADPKLAASLAQDGFPALAALPYSGSGISVSYVGYTGSQAVVNVRYQASRAAAGKSFADFLAAHGDSTSRYKVRWFDAAASRALVNQRKMLPLAMRGYNSLIDVPYTGHGIDIRFIRLQDGKAIIDVRYHGSKAAARRALKNFFAAYADSASKYIIRLHR